MTRISIAVLLSVAAVAALAGSGTESKWKVTHGTKAVATITLLTSSAGIRAEWSAGSAPLVFLRVKNETWVRQTGGDVELAGYTGSEEKSIVPALMAVDPSVEKVLKVNAGTTTYTVTRTSFGPSNADDSNFVVRSKKGSSSKIAKLSGDLFGSSSSGVSATAGGRGVGNSGMKLKDGGDYDAVATLEKRDSAWKGNLDEALKQFQKSGKVGKERE
jgi:hypothetical protein